MEVLGGHSTCGADGGRGLPRCARPGNHSLASGPDKGERPSRAAECIIGRGAYVGPGVLIGDNVKLQNYALVYEPARLEDGVFIGPAAVLTNDLYPRSVDPRGRLKRAADWDASGVVVREGASLGARVVVVPGRVIGRWAMVAAGAVVTHDVPDYALVAGIPARQIGWVGRAGERLLAEAPGRWRCPQSDELYAESGGVLCPDTS